MCWSAGGLGTASSSPTAPSTLMMRPMPVELRRQLVASSDYNPRTWDQVSSGVELLIITESQKSESFVGSAPLLQFHAQPVCQCFSLQRCVALCWGSARGGGKKREQKPLSHYCYGLHYRRTDQAAKRLSIDSVNKPNRLRAKWKEVYDGCLDQYKLDFGDIPKTWPLAKQALHKMNYIRSAMLQHGWRIDKFKQGMMWFPVYWLMEWGMWSLVRQLYLLLGLWRNGVRNGHVLFKCVAPFPPLRDWSSMLGWGYWRAVD